MSKPNAEPTFDTVERFAHVDGTSTFLQHFRDGGYIMVELNEKGYELYWATELGPVDTLAVVRELIGLPDGDYGYVQTKDDMFDGDAVPQVVRSIWRDPQSVESYDLEGELFDLRWEAPLQRWKWTNAQYAQIGLCVRGLKRAAVQPVVEVSAIPSVRGAIDLTCSTLAHEVPLLQQA